MRKWLWLIVPAVVIAAGAAVWFWPAPRRLYPLTVSPQTTYLTAPLRPDGTVDYLAAMDEHLRQGVTAENNAAVPLMEILGAGQLTPADQIGQIRAALGLPPLPSSDGTTTALADDATFVFHEQFARRSGATTQATMPAPANIDKTDDEDALPATAAPRESRPVNVRKFLQFNRKALDRIVWATHRARFYLPILVGDNALGANDGHIRSMRLLPLFDLEYLGGELAARARLRVQDNDLDGAWTDLQACHRLARLLAQVPFDTAQLLSRSLDLETCKVELDLIHSVTMTPRQLRNVLNDRAAMPPLAPPLETVLRAERLAALDQACLFATEGVELALTGVGEPRPGATFDIDAGLARVNAHFDQLVQAAGEPTLAGRLAGVRAVEQKLALEKASIAAIKPGLLARNDRIGQFEAAAAQAPAETLWVEVAPELTASLVAAGQVERISRGVQTLLALELHHLERGQYPATLEALVPDYLPAAPTDPLTDQPLPYRLQGDAYELYLQSDARPVAAPASAPSAQPLTPIETLPTDDPTD